MSQPINIHDAKTQLSKLVDRVQAGEEIVIAKAGEPAAKLVPLPKTKTVRKLGLLDGQIQVPDDFNAPLPGEVLDLFEGQR